MSLAARFRPLAASRFAEAASLWPLLGGGFLLAVLWLGPLPERAEGSFAAHMVMHMGVVALAAPLVGFGLSRAFPAKVAAIPPAVAIAAAFAEFAVIWAWHAPGLHDAARVRADLFVLEQGSFLLVGLLVWTSAIGAAGEGRLAARAAGVAALLLTTMHMTLLGALLMLSPRPLYACAELCAPAASMTPLEDQQLGGVIMLIVGGAVYLGGGLALLASILRDPRPAAEGGA